MKYAVAWLQVSLEQIETVLEDMESDKTVIVTKDRNVYLPSLYYAELNCARMLWDLNISLGRRDDLDFVIDGIEKQEKEVYNDLYWNR